jgi:hypothetical protein
LNEVCNQASRKLYIRQRLFGIYCAVITGLVVILVDKAFQAE